MLARTFAGKGRRPSTHLPRELGVRRSKRGKAASCPWECPFCKFLSTPSAMSNVDVEESDVTRRTTSHQCCPCALKQQTCSALAAVVGQQVTNCGSATNSMSRACPVSVPACANLLNSLRQLAMPMVMHLSSGMLEGMAAKQEDLRQLAMPMVMHLSSGTLEAMAARQEDQKWWHEEVVVLTSPRVQSRRFYCLTPCKSVVFLSSWMRHASDVQAPWPTPLPPDARHQQKLDSPFHRVFGD